MPNWTAFAGGTIAVLVVLLVLSHLTQSAFEETPDSAEPTDRSDAFSTDSSDGDGEESVGEPIARGTPSSGVPDDRPAVDRPTDSDDRPTNGDEGRSSSDAADTELPSSADNQHRGDEQHHAGDQHPSVHAESSSSDAPFDESPPVESTPPDPADMSTGMVLANVALSQGVFAVVLIGAAIYTDIPLEALGLEISRSWLLAGLSLGTGFGIALYVANEIGAAISTWVGFEHDEQLRDMLGPDSLSGWIVLLAFVLPIIAVFEELLFRAALIGVFEAGFDISPWLLAVASSIAFGLGHGMQGSVGILVTGALGFVLAAAFVLTGNLLVVVVAHYLINALEFVVHEGIGFEWAAVLERGG